MLARPPATCPRAASLGWEVCPPHAPSCRCACRGNLLGVAPATAIFMAVYEPAKRAIAAEHTPQTAFVVSAALAGWAASLVRVPTEVVKQRIQAGEFARPGQVRPPAAPTQLSSWECSAWEHPQPLPTGVMHASARSAAAPAAWLPPSPLLYLQPGLLSCVGKEHDLGAVAFTVLVRAAGASVVGLGCGALWVPWWCRDRLAHALPHIAAASQVCVQLAACTHAPVTRVHK